jgi:hypothetical protein
MQKIERCLQGTNDTRYERLAPPAMQSGGHRLFIEASYEGHELALEWLRERKENAAWPASAGIDPRNGTALPERWSLGLRRF